MPRTMSVVLSAVEDGSGGDWLVDVVRSLDGQTLPPEAFEVLVVAGPESTVAARLSDLASRRPNVRVLEAGADVVAAATGEWLLDLGHDVARMRPRLLPQTLRRLADAGAQAGADVVLGRTCTSGSLLVEDAMVPCGSDLDTDAALALVAAFGHAPRPLVGRRTQRLRDAAVDVPAPRVAAVIDYPCAVVDAEVLATEPAPSTWATARWSDGVLGVRVEVDPSAVPDVPAGARAVLGVVSNGVEYFLPTRTTMSAGGRLVAETDLDVRIAALGDALPAGSWRVTVGVHGSAPRHSLRAAVPAVAGLGSALVGGLPVVLVPGRDLVLDVGGRTAGVVGLARSEDARVVESARGTLLQLDLPHVHAVGDARVRGSLHLGAFPVPADLVIEGGAARLECWLSGLAGSSPLAAQFGAPKAPIGLTLDIDEVGAMTVRTTPPKAAAEQQPTAAKKPAAQSRALAARIRQAVPSWLEPAVRWLRRIPAARRIYRALLERG